MGKILPDKSPNQAFIRHGGEANSHTCSCIYTYQRAVDIYRDGIAQYISRDVPTTYEIDATATCCISANWRMPYKILDTAYNL